MELHEDESYRNLWRAVISRAERDLLRAPESVALDALEFLRTTGVWLWSEVLGTYNGLDAKIHVLHLVRQRNRWMGCELPLWKLTGRPYTGDAANVNDY